MSRKLANLKHEAFAVLLSRGFKQNDSYFQVYGNKNAGRASHLAAKYKARVFELRGENVKALPALSEGPTLSEMGIDLAWITAAYAQILDRAIALDKLADANKATQNLERLLKAEASENAQAEVDKVPENRIDINNIGTVLDKVTAMLTAAKAPDTMASPTWAEMKAVRAVNMQDDAAN